MNRKTSSLAIEVIRRATREQPADAVLREVLKAEKSLPGKMAGEVVEAVYSFYRWRGWLNAGYPMSQQIVYASKLQADFSENPASIAERNIQNKAVPDWVGDELKVSINWLKALQQPARVWLRAKRGTRERVAANLEDCVPSETVADALEYTGAKDLFHTPGFKSGDFEVQDINSQRVGLVCAPQPGETWWDACAGEGGKTMHLSDLMQNKGMIWCSDRAEWRLKRLKKRAARGKAFNYRAVLWDGGPKPPTKTMFDGVLVDAPCSGLGTWQRNPHARWTTTPEDVKELAEIQTRLLTHVAPSVKPGGRLVYSVCTVTRRETAEIVKQFTKQFPDFQLERVPDTKQGFLWPENTGGNGMFITVWRRKPSAA